MKDQFLERFASLREILRQEQKANSRGECGESVSS
jgi:hypothetical protein